MQESEILLNLDINKTLVPLKRVTESIRNLMQYGEVTDDSLCDEKSAITKYLNMEERATTGVDSHLIKQLKIKLCWRMNSQ
jgi:hypothetical protein